jgi:ribosome-associated translation inhibitor RaiA
LLVNCELLVKKMTDESEFQEFYIDFNIETPEAIDEGILDETDRRLRALTENHTDITGAAVSLESIAGVEHDYLYQARIVVYMRPKQIASVAKNKNPRLAIKDALSDLERNIGKSRTRRKETWQRTDIQTDLSVHDLSAKEIFNTYFDEEKEDPEDLIRQGRDKIATQLIANKQLDQETAYYAADRILEYAADITGESE